MKFNKRREGRFTIEKYGRFDSEQRLSLPGQSLNIAEAFTAAREGFAKRWYGVFHDALPDIYLDDMGLANAVYVLEFVRFVVHMATQLERASKPAVLEPGSYGELIADLLSGNIKPSDVDGNRLGLAFCWALLERGEDDPVTRELGLEVDKLLHREEHKG